LNVVFTKQEAFVWKDDIVNVIVTRFICSYTFQEMYSKVTFSCAKGVRNTNFLAIVHVKYQ